MHIETAHRKRTFCGCLHIALTTLALISSATAAGSCQGTYAATLLQPLPAQIVVGLDIHDRSPRNLRLAEHFCSCAQMRPKGRRHAYYGSPRCSARWLAQTRASWRKTLAVSSPVPWASELSGARCNASSPYFSPKPWHLSR